MTRPSSILTLDTGRDLSTGTLTASASDIILNVIGSALLGNVTLNHTILNALTGRSFTSGNVKATLSALTLDTGINTITGAIGLSGSSLTIDTGTSGFGGSLMMADLTADWSDIILNAVKDTFIGKANLKRTTFDALNGGSFTMGDLFSWMSPITVLAGTNAQFGQGIIWDTLMQLIIGGTLTMGDYSTRYSQMTLSSFGTAQLGIFDLTLTDLDVLTTGTGADILFKAINAPGNDVRLIASRRMGALRNPDESTGYDITADSLLIHSLGGDIGYPTDYLRTMVDSLNAQAWNIYLLNGKSLLINQIITPRPGGIVKLTVIGSIYAGKSEIGPQHIYTDNLVLRAYGRVGQKDNPLNVILMPGGKFVLYLRGGNWYSITGARAHVVWFGGIIDIIDYQLPESDLDLTIDEGGIGKPEGLSVEAYFTLLRDWLDKVLSTIGNLEMTILRFYPGLPQHYFDKVENLYHLILQVLEPDFCNLLDANTGIRIILPANTQVMILKAELTAPISEITGTLRAYACNVFLMDTPGVEVTLTANATLTFRIPGAAGLSVTARHLGADGQWEEQVLIADASGDVQITVNSLGSFEFLINPEAPGSNVGGEKI